jgi:hypothetical protein
VVDFCDLSGKVGLGSTHTSVRRLVTQLRAIDFLVARFRPGGSARELIERMHFAVEGDREFLLAVRSGREENKG